MEMETVLFLVVAIVISYIIGQLVERVKLPKLLGYLLVGLIFGNFTAFSDIFTTESIQIITSFALAVILLKAGLGIERAIIKKIGFRVLLLGIIPNLIEGVIVSMFGLFVLNFSINEAFMFGFIISAVSPAVVIPSMTRLMDKGYDKTITTLNLAATSFDDVVSLTIFGVFLSVYLGTGNPTVLLLLAPIKIILGALLGALIGYLLGRILKETMCLRYQIYQFILIMGLAIVIKEFGSYIFIIEMIALMTLGYYINDTNKSVGFYIKQHTTTVWKFAQIPLFFMIGFLSKIDIIGEYLFIGLLIISIGLMGRTIGVIIALFRSSFDAKQKGFTMVSNLPKATVQAVLGAIPLAHGVENGDTILSISALAIIVTAPVGLLLIEILSKKLLKKEAI